MKRKGYRPIVTANAISLIVRRLFPTTGWIGAVCVLVANIGCARYGEEKNASVPAKAVVDSAITATREDRSEMASNVAPGDEYRGLDGDVYRDAFTSNSLTSIWSTATLVDSKDDTIAGARISVRDGALELTNPVAPEAMQDMQVYCNAFAAMDFEASVDFRIPEGDPGVWFYAREPGAVYAPFEGHIFAVFFNASREEYGIWQRNADGDAFLGNQPSVFGDEQSEWHRLTLQYDASSGLSRALVDQQVLPFVGRIEPGQIEICLELKKMPDRDREATIEFDNFELRLGSAAK